MTYSYLNYSDDYDLDVVASTSSGGSTKRQLVFNKRKVIVESKIRVKGSLIKPYVYHQKVIGKSFSIVEASSSYHGSIGLTGIKPIKGSLIEKTATPYGVTGTSKLGVMEKVLVTGKKEYTELKRVLNKYLSSSDIQEGYVKLITSYPLKSE